MSDPHSLSTGDLFQHVVKLGCDVYPPVVIRDERTRLNIFFEQIQNEYPNVYEQLVASNEKFEISKSYRTGPSSSPANVPTFVLVEPRGPVFVFPILLPRELGGPTGLGEEYLEIFANARRFFAHAFPGRKLMRVGLVRELLFQTGDWDCRDLFGTPMQLSGAEFFDGEAINGFRDDQCNVRISFKKRTLSKSVRTPIGQEHIESLGNFLLVKLDVNNFDARPLDDADVDGIIERARSLWPDPLLEYLKERSQSQ